MENLTTYFVSRTRLACAGNKHKRNNAQKGVPNLREIFAAASEMRTLLMSVTSSSIDVGTDAFV